MQSASPVLEAIKPPSASAVAFQGEDPRLDNRKLFGEKMTRMDFFFLFPISKCTLAQRITEPIFHGLWPPEWMF
jgi:hypothetical protein